MYKRFEPLRVPLMTVQISFKNITKLTVLLMRVPLMTVHLSFKIITKLTVPLMMRNLIQIVASSGVNISKTLYVRRFSWILNINIEK